jgi:hypothetical protein
MGAFETTTTNAKISTKTCCSFHWQHADTTVDQVSVLKFDRQKNASHVHHDFQARGPQLWQLKVSYAPMDWQIPRSHIRLFLRFAFSFLSHSMIFDTVINLMAVLVLIAAMVERKPVCLRFLFNHTAVKFLMNLIASNVLSAWSCSADHAESVSVTRTN